MQAHMPDIGTANFNMTNLWVNSNPSVANIQTFIDALVAETNKLDVRVLGPNASSKTKGIQVLVKPKEHMQAIGL
jgi:hypothetical protein